MSTPRTLVTVRGLLGDDAALYIGNVLWILSHALRSEILATRPLVAQSRHHTGIIRTMLERAERLEISCLMPIPVCRGDYGEPSG